MIKRLYFTLIILLTAFTAMAEGTAVLPVLKVNIKGGASLTDKYQKGNMQLIDEDGQTVGYEAKFKTRGATSLNYTGKPSFNMKLRDADGNSLDAPLLGMREAASWILDAMAIDRICMRNRVAFDLWNEFSQTPYQTEFNGRNGTVGHFVEVYINDTYKGIYCLTDRINRKLLDLKKVKPKQYTDVDTIRGVLYKSGTSDISNQNERNHLDDWTAYTIGWHNAWELTEPEDYECEEAWQPLLDAYDNGHTYDYVKKYFFLKQLAEYQVFIMALAIQDNWGNKNHFFSIRNMQKDINDTELDEDGTPAGERRRFVITPWDLDTSLGGAYDGRNYNGNYTNWSPEDIVKNGGHYPYSLCQGRSDYKLLLKEAWQRARSGAFSVDNVSRKLEQYRDLFLSTGAWDRMLKAGVQPKSVTDLTEEIRLIEQWYAARVIQLDTYFGTTDAIDDVTDDNVKSLQKFNLSGQAVNDAYRGIYIRNGKKYATR